jgi:hypothetical protein
MVPAAHAQQPETIPFGVAQPTAPARNGFYSTKQPDAAPVPPSANLPWQQADPEVIAPPPVIAAPGQQSTPQFPAGYMPFKRGSSTPVPGAPSALPMDRAVPVENIDGIEVTEPAAPMDMQDVANPVADNPATPTELTAPLFAADGDSKSPREIELRVLNKVTAQAELLKAKPGATIEFGRLSIEAVQCYQSSPSSQPDSVALLKISEHVPEQEKPKLLFHGWMYQSSPSITSLEHPVYDVTMVDCSMKAQTPADAVKADTEQKPKKPAKK